MQTSHMNGTDGAHKDSLKSSDWPRLPGFESVSPVVKLCKAHFVYNYVVFETLYKSNRYCNCFSYFCYIFVFAHLCTLVVKHIELRLTGNVLSSSNLCHVDLVFVSNDCSFIWNVRILYMVSLAEFDQPHQAMHGNLLVKINNRSLSAVSRSLV